MAQSESETKIPDRLTKLILEPTAKGYYPRTARAVHSVDLIANKLYFDGVEVRCRKFDELNELQREYFEETIESSEDEDEDEKEYNRLRCKFEALAPKEQMKYSIVAWDKYPETISNDPLLLEIGDALLARTFNPDLPLLPEYIVGFNHALRGPSGTGIPLPTTGRGLTMTDFHRMLNDLH